MNLEVTETPAKEESLLNSEMSEASASSDGRRKSVPSPRVAGSGTEPLIPGSSAAGFIF